MPSPFRFPAYFGERPSVITGTKVLDGLVYGFRFLPNVRVNDGRGAFYVDLFNARAQAVLRGIKVVLTDDLFGRYRTAVADVPPGRVVVRRTDGLDTDPAIFDLSVPGESVRLQSLGSPAVVVEYVSLAEIAAAQGVQLS